MVKCICFIQLISTLEIFSSLVSSEGGHSAVAEVLFDSCILILNIPGSMYILGEIPLGFINLSSNFLAAKNSGLKPRKYFDIIINSNGQINQCKLGISAIYCLYIGFETGLQTRVVIRYKPVSSLAVKHNIFPMCVLGRMSVFQG